MNYKGTLTWLQGAMNSGPFPEQACRTGSYSSFWMFSHSRTVQFPQHHVLFPFPEHATPESTKESCSASQWQESNWHFTSELTEQGEQD